MTYFILHVNLVNAAKRPNSSVNYWQVFFMRVKQFISCRGMFFAERRKIEIFKNTSACLENNFDMLLINGQLQIYESNKYNRLRAYIF